MTYEFAKHIADNLRFGSYNNKRIQFESPESVVIEDINSNTYVSFYINNMTNWKEIRSKWSSKKDWEKVEEGAAINVYTGILPRRMETENYFSINTEHADYTFWKEFQTFTEAAYNDKIYKHNCVIEEVFVL